MNRAIPPSAQTVPDDWQSFDPATRLVHDFPYPGDAISPPIYQTSLFAFASYEEMAARFRGETTRPLYSRGDNPTVQELEQKLADLEGGAAARGFSSGMGAISSAVLSVVQQGERVVCVRHVYPDTYRLFQQLLPRFGIRVDYVDGRDADAVAAALPGARLLYLESPTTLVYETQDLPVMAELARRHGVTTIIDNSWATPLNQQPLKHGIDIVLHSASKYISGHSDTVAGIVVCDRAHMQQIMALTYPFLGAKLAPFEAWLLLRGLRTLPLRMARHAATARLLAARLREHAAVVRVYQPEPATAATLTGICGLLSLEFAPHIDIAAFCNALQLFRLGVSWGGYESLAMPAKIACQQTGEVNSLRDFAVPEQLVRLSVGLEDGEDLWRDLQQAIARGSGSS
jgi:cystathionine beta-lyase/cystathionine gamma-synthase